MGERPTAREEIVGFVAYILVPLAVLVLIGWILQR